VTAILLIVGILILLVLRFNVIMALALPALIYFVAEDVPVSIFALRAFAGVDEFTLVAIPLFVLVGAMLQASRVLNDLIAVLRKGLARFRSGLVLANVFDSAAFSGISGSAAADVATLGPISIPLMKRAGYPASYAAAVTAATSIVGPIIPPSIVFIFYGAIADVPIPDLFLAGVVPGLLLVLSFALLVVVQSRRFASPAIDSSTVSLSNWIGTLVVVGMGAFIILSIASGLATVTESAGIASASAVVFALARLRVAFPKAFVGELVRAGRLSMDVLLLIAVSNVLAWIFTIEGVSQGLGAILGHNTGDRYTFFAIVIGAMLFVGIFLDTFPAIVLTVPVITPVADSLGVSPIQTGVVVVLSLMVGAVHPPVGVCLYMSCRIADASVWEAFFHIIPFILAVLAVLAVVATVPSLTTFLPAVLG